MLVKKPTLVAGDPILSVSFSLVLVWNPNWFSFYLFCQFSSKMITGVLRRSSLPSRHSLSAALTSFDSGLSHHFSSAATVSSVSVDRNLVGNGSTLSSNLISRFASPSSPKSWMVSPARIAFQGYATEPESNLRDSKRVCFCSHSNSWRLFESLTNCYLWFWVEEREHVKDQRNEDLHSDSVIREPGEGSLVSSSPHSLRRNARHADLVHRATFPSRGQEVEGAVWDEVQETVSRCQSSEPRAEQEAVLVEALPYPRSSVRTPVPLQDPFGHVSCLR